MLEELGSQEGVEVVREVGVPPQVPLEERLLARLREALGEPKRVLAVLGLGQQGQARAQGPKGEARNPLREIPPVEAQVAREHLVAPVAIEGHRHMAARQLRE